MIYIILDFSRIMNSYILICIEKIDFFFGLCIICCKMVGNEKKSSCGEELFTSFRP